MAQANKQFFDAEFKEKAFDAARTGLIFAIVITPVILVSTLLGRALSK